MCVYHPDERLTWRPCQPPCSEWKSAERSPVIRGRSAFVWPSSVGRGAHGVASPVQRRFAAARRANASRGLDQSIRNRAPAASSSSASSWPSAVSLTSVDRPTEASEPPAPVRRRLESRSDRSQDGARSAQRQLLAGRHRPGRLEGASPRPAPAPRPRLHVSPFSRRTRPASSSSSRSSATEPTAKCTK